jgi:type I restriction enzyme S subunit
MGLKQGYKQTDVGVIPEDWEVKRLGAFIALQRGHDLTDRDRRKGEIPVMGSAGQNGFHDTALVSGPGVVVGRSGASFGQAHYCATDFWPHNTALYVTDFFGNHPLFAFYFLKRMDFSRHNTGGAQQSLNRNFIAPIPIAVPSRSEQEIITEALSDADTLIESLEQLLTKKRHLKQGAMQELLTGKKRLLGFAGKWEIKRLEELADIRSGGTPSTTQTQFWDGDIPWCTPTDITALDGFKFLSDTNRRISDQGLKASSAEMIPANSIVMTSRATIGECAINQVPVSTNQGFKNFVPFEDVDTEFLYYLLHLQKQGFISLCGGSTFLEIGKTQLAKYEVRMPSTKSEQFAIATILSDMDTEIATLETKLTKARQLKTGMMQELLTGRIRLVRPSASVVPFVVVQEADANRSKSHNPQINEAVVIAVLTSKFGTEQYPLARVRRTKLTYLLHRHVEHEAMGFLKKAAGPYNPATRYGGPEKIALNNRYVCSHNNGKYEGFVAAENISQANAYFEKWYGSHVLEWIEQFRFKSTEELELLSTIDMASEDLRNEGKAVSLPAVKQVLRSNAEWKVKLNRPIFSDSKIAAAIQLCHQLFAPEGETA